MAEISALYAHAPNTHSQAELAKSLSVLGSTGVIKGSGNELAVTQSTPAAMSIDVDTGEAWIEGYYYGNTTKATWVIDALANPALNRIDRVTVESDPLTDLESKIVIVKGVEGAVPVAPALTQVSGGVWQISVAQVLVATGAASIVNAAITNEVDTPVICEYAHGLDVAKANSLYSATLPKLNGTFTGFAQNHGAGFGCCTDGTNLYVIGGQQNPYNCVSKYTSSWATKATKTTAGCYFSPVYYNGNIYIFGGINGAVNTSLANTDIYNIAGDSWSAGTAKPTASHYHAAVYHYDSVLGHQIYCFGGQKTAGGVAYITTVDIYSIPGNSWTSGAVLPSTPTAGEVVGVSDGSYIYLVYTDAGGVKMYKYDVTADSYAALTAPTVQVTNMFYHNGYIYGTHAPVLGVLYRYNISTDVWTQVSTDTGITSAYRQVVQLTDKRYVAPIYAGTNSVYYTYYYNIGTALTDSIYSFRVRGDINFKLFNITTQVAEPSIGVATNDLYGLYVNLKTVTTTGLLVEVMG